MNGTHSASLADKMSIASQGKKDVLTKVKVEPSKNILPDQEKIKIMTGIEDISGTPKLRAGKTKTQTSLVKLDLE